MAQTLLSPHPEAGKSERSQKTSGFMFASMVTLASWRFRHTWFLLLMTLLGMIAAIVITCAVPLFSSVTDTASLRETLRSSPLNSEIALSVSPLGLTSNVASDIYRQLNAEIQPRIAPYTSQPPVFQIISNNFAITSPSLLKGSYELNVFAQSMHSAASHLVLDQGRLPHTINFINGIRRDGNEVELMLTADTAASLGVHVGSMMTLNYGYYNQLPNESDNGQLPPPTSQASIQAHVVGIFHVPGSDLSYWHSNDFSYQLIQQNGRKINAYSFLMDSDGLLHVFDTLAQQQHIAVPFTIYGNYITWYYHIDPQRVSISNVGDLNQRVTTLKQQIDTRFGAQESYDVSYSNYNLPPYPYIFSLQFDSPLFQTDNSPGLLNQFQQRIQVARIPAFIISVQIVALLLVFISLMTDLLIERQASAIAILRSRGASRGQIFGALMTQSVGLGALALLVGLPLALTVVLLVSHAILPASVQDATGPTSTQPLQALLSTSGYGLVVVLVLLLTMVFSLVRASQMDVLSSRREAARARRRPLWQRLHLDILLIGVMLAVYLIGLYLSTIGNVLNDVTKTIVSTIFNLFSPYLLILLCLLIFLRIFPFLLNVAASLATRGRSAASMLALAQMSRSPRLASRMTTLLALALTFAIFSFVLTATQAQRTEDIAAYQVGSDFAFALPPTTNALSLSGLRQQFEAIPGVVSASAGYINTGTVGDGSIPLTFDIRGVDTSTFGQTARWPSQVSSESLPVLLNKLKSAKSYGIAHNVVPVIVDATAARVASLHVGSTILISQDAGNDSLLLTDLHCYVVGIINNIPTTNVDAPVVNNGYYNQRGGVLMDFQTYNIVYKQQSLQAQQGPASITPNYVWVRTKDDATSVAQVRSALEKLSSSLYEMQDRRATLDMLNTDPLLLTLVGILSIGTLSTLLIALLGDLLTSWLSARSRLTNFVVLRALGTSSSQVASVLAWEQGLLYIAGIVLGIVFGILLVNTVVPALVYYGIGFVIPLAVRLVVPVSLFILLASLLLVFVIALTLMVRVVTHPSMSQTLRLNED